MARTTALFAALVITLTTCAAAAQTERLDTEGHWSFSTQLNLSAVTLEDDVLDQEGAAFLGGFGVNTRIEFPRRVAAEFGFSGVHRESANALVRESVFLLSTSMLWYLGRGPSHRFYVVGGILQAHTERDIGEHAHFQFLEIGLQGGVGADFLLSDHWMLSLDARLYAMASEPTEGAQYDYPDGSRPYPGRWARVPDVRGGSRATVAFGYRF